MVQLENFLYNEFLEWNEIYDMLKSDCFIKRQDMPKEVMIICSHFMGKSTNETVDEIDFVPIVKYWCEENNINCTAILMRTQYGNEDNSGTHYRNSWVGILFECVEDAVAFKLKFLI